MKDSTAAIIGGLCFVGGCATVCAIGAGKVKLMDDKLTGICKAMDEVTHNVDLTVPENIAEIAMRKAAEKASERAISGVKEVAMKECSSELKKAVNEAYKSVEGDIKEKLESQINLASIERIEKQVSEKVAEKMFRTAPFNTTAPTSKESIIKTCADNGMSAYEINRILETLNK